MSDDTQKKGQPAPNAAPPPPSKGGVGRLVFLLLPAILAGGSAFGGAKIAGAHRSAPAAADHAEHPAPPKPPGPTLSVDPFLLTISDANKKAHPMKVTVAIEFDSASKEGKEEGMKELTPRIRDSLLGYLRRVPYEEAFDAANTDKLRGEMLEAVKAGGAPEAQRVLITDLVTQ